MEPNRETAARELLKARKESKLNAQTAKLQYVAALADQTTSVEVKAILKHEYEDCSALAKSAHETAQTAQHRLWNSPITASLEASTQDSEDLDEEDKRLSILGKRARNSLSKLARHMAEPAGGWYDKQGKLHSHHAEQAKRLGELLDNTWYVMDLFQSP